MQYTKLGGIVPCLVFYGAGGIVSALIIWAVVIQRAITIIFIRVANIAATGSWDTTVF